MNKDLYRETFSQLHTSVVVSEEWFAMKQKRPRGFWRKTMLLAAAVAALLCVGLTAYAVYQYSLGDLLMGKEEIALPLESGQGPEDQACETVDMISLAGFRDSPEYRAAVEWREFCNRYDPDGEIRAQIGNKPVELDSCYTEYSCYTQEMADKLEEIAGRYGLQKRGTCRVLETRALLEEQVGNFAPGLDSVSSGYLYDNGTFCVEGEYPSAGGSAMDFQFRRSVKGYLEDTALNIGDLTGYEQQQYETAGGTRVILALSPHTGLICADLPGSFVTVNVLAGSGEGTVTARDLERLADAFDWKVLSDNTVKDPTPEMGEIFGVGSWSAPDLAAGYGGKLSAFLGSWRVREVRAVEWAYLSEKANARVGEIITYDPDGAVIWDRVRYDNLDSYEFWGGYTPERMKFDYKADLTDWWPEGAQSVYFGCIPALDGGFGTYFYTDGAEALWIYDEGCFYRMERTEMRSPLPELADPAEEDVPVYRGAWPEVSMADEPQMTGFLGRWVPREVRYCAVSALPAERAEALLGGTVAYSREGITCGGVLTPVGSYEIWAGYTPTRILTDYGADLSDWWIRLGAMYGGSAAGAEETFGSRFFYSGSGVLWIYYEGAFFRCERAEAQQ